MINAGLVLEGGGMKGIYTAGVLDFFMEKDMYFKNCYGVSAGACHLCSYISKQTKRAYRISLDYLDDPNYCSPQSLLKTGDLFNVDMCYNRIPTELDPYDYKAAASYEGNAYAVVTNIRTGKAEYHPMKEMHHDTISVRASASLPLVSRNVEIKGQLYLDGGLADSIPIEKSLADGNEKNIIILTKEVGYIRQPNSKALMAMIKARYHRYPKLISLMANRHTAYNKTLSDIENYVKQGKAYVIRPALPNDIQRVEKDRSKLEAFYWVGYNDAKSHYEEIKEYLNL